uniref:Membrane-spanning 4-domains subfamily A member 6A isoform X1 n=2 Tax=Castor canadensis TaxID=51338 RepID=A0A8B7W599_CASCN|nr:membrane-spanning 4-domains subfamily A member 6A isoform X1 [Castor canadensis]
MSSIGGTIMISQIMAGETVTVITPNGINFPQTEQPQSTHQMQDSLKKRLKAEIKIIGAIQIMCGVMVLSLGITLGSGPFSPHFTPMFSVLIKSGYPFVGSLCFIISGSVSIITEKMSNKRLVRSSLAMSSLSAVFAIMGFIILCVNLSSLGSASQLCDLSKLAQPTTYYSYDYYHNRYARGCLIATASLNGVISVMLICTFLELVLAVLTALLWWKQASCSVPGSVHFLSQSSKNEFSSPSKELSSPAYEELLNP